MNGNSPVFVPEFNCTIIHMVIIILIPLFLFFSAARRRGEDEDDMRMLASWGS